MKLFNYARLAIIATLISGTFATDEEEENGSPEMRQALSRLHVSEDGRALRGQEPQPQGHVMGMGNNILLNSTVMPTALFQNILSFLSLSGFANLAATCIYWRDNTIQGKVVIMGPAGGGKSTLVHILMRKQLVSEKSIGGGRRLSAQEMIPNIIIEHGMRAGTREPTSVIDFYHKTVIVDCPGFGDPRGKDQDFSNALAIHSLLQGKIKVVLVVSEDNLCDRQPFVALINKMTELFPDDSQLQDVLTLVVNRRRDVETIRFLQILQEQPYLTQRGRDLLGFLGAHENRVIEISYPNPEGLFSVSEHLEAFMQNRNYVLNPQVTVPVQKSVCNASSYSRWSSEFGYDEHGQQNNRFY